MIKNIKVSAFKSLVDFEIELGKFNCIIGLNGAGKSTLLQLISYLSAIFEGKVSQWLRQRHWQSDEVVSSYYPTRETIDFEVKLEFEGDYYLWNGIYNWKKGFCTRETLSVMRNKEIENERRLFQVFQGRVKHSKGFEEEVYFNYSGSILSVLTNETIPFEIQRVKDYISNIESHELLSPKVMQAGHYSKKTHLGSTGEYLINYIHNLEDSDRRLVKEQLSGYFKQVINITTKTQIDGTLSMQITERFYDDTGEHFDITTDARHINDGMLRILNLLANQRSKSKFQLFDEIENGVNPEITEKLMDGFVSSPQQTLITTHSPMVLNYLTDDDAIRSVVLVYKRKDGKTRSKHLFEIPSAKNKLSVLSPGEAMVDLYLEQTALEAEMIENEGVSK